MNISVLVQILLFILSSMNVESQEEGELPCVQENYAGCSKVLCDLINNRKSKVCDFVQCEGITEDDCQGEGVYFEYGISMCGCCNGCARYLKEGDECDASPPVPVIDPNCTDLFCPVLKRRCMPGLVCNVLGGSSRRCAYDPNVAPKDDTCWDKKNMYLVDQLHWNPSCEADNTYSPKQCKGQHNEDGVCFCVDEDGKRIFGREWKTKSANQTCACSRMVDILRKRGNIAALHCSADGNFEPLQCDMDSGICYCVDPQTGELDGALVPEHQYHLLPCHSTELMNETYLRVCESEWVAWERIRREGNMHGVNVLAAKDLKCDFDGSYQPIHRIKGVSHCVDKFGLPNQYFQEIDLRPMDCNCYRDSVLFGEEDRPFLKYCAEGTGNYAVTSESNQHNVSCVDQDGFFMGTSVPKYLECCLLGECPNNLIQNFCYDPVTNPGGIKKCPQRPI